METPTCYDSDALTQPNQSQEASSLLDSPNGFRQRQFRGMINETRTLAADSAHKIVAAGSIL
jgi:hypothetical protein